MDLFKLVGTIAIEGIDKVESALDSASKKAASIGQGFQDAGKKISGVGKAMLPVTTAIGGAGVAAVKTAADFESAMSEVSAISGATGEDFDKLKEKAREMGSKTKFSASQAAEAMNYMAMAGWKTKDMIGGIDGIMNLAAASGEDLATTSDIVTDALTAFGKSAKDAGELADIMAAASSNANTNVGLMGETFKYAAPIAGAMGYTMQDTALAIGLMANAGIKGSQAGTSLRSMFTRLASPPKECAVAMKELGVSITNADGTMKPFREVIDDLRIGFNGLSEAEQAEYAKAIAGQEAMSGLLAIVNAAPSDINKLKNAIDDSNGAAEEMSEIMQDNLNGQLTILKSALEEAAISIGDALVPSIKKAVEKIQEWTDKFNELDDSQKETIIKIAGIVAIIGPLLIVLGKLTTAIGSIIRLTKLGIPLLSGFFKVFKLGIKGVGLAGTGIGKFAGLVGRLGGTIARGIGTALSGIGNFVVTGLETAWEALWAFGGKVTTFVSGLGPKIATAASKIGTSLAGIGTSIGSFLTADIGTLLASGSVATVGATIGTALCGGIIAAVGGFKLGKKIGATLFGDEDGVYSNFHWFGEGGFFPTVGEEFNYWWEEDVKPAFEKTGAKLSEFGRTYSEFHWFGDGGFFPTVGEEFGYWYEEDIKPHFTKLGEGISESFNSAKESAAAKFGEIKTTIQDNLYNACEIATTKASEIKQNVTDAWENVKAKTHETWTNVKTKVSESTSNIKQKVSESWSNVKQKTHETWTNVKQKISEAVENAKQKTSDMKNTITNNFNTAKDNVINAMNRIKEGISTAFSSAVEAVKNGMSRIKEALSEKLPSINLPVVGNAINTAAQKLGIKKHAKGGIMTKPTFLGFDGQNMHIGGEAGAEAILPIEKLKSYISETTKEENESIAPMFSDVLAMLQQIDKRIADLNQSVIAPIYIGEEKLDEIMINTKERVNFRSGGLASV